MTRQQLHKTKAMILFCVIAVLVFASFPFQARAADFSTQPIKVMEMVSGDTPTSKETFQVVMKRVDANAPMPNGASGDTATIHIQGEQSGSFGEITYARPGVYHYQILQSSGSTKGYTYDSRTYTVEIHVTNTEKPMIILKDDSSGEKVKEIKFSNTYTKETSKPGSTGKLQITMEFHGAIPATEKVEVKIEFEGTGDKSFIYTDGNGNVLGKIHSGDKIDMRDGDVIIIIGLPAGTKYTVTQTPKAYFTPNPIIGTYSGTIVADQTSKAPFVNWYNKTDPTPASIDPPVQKQVSGKGAPGDSKFTFRMKPKKADNPMPDDAVDGVIKKDMIGAGSLEMGWITFTKAGTYQYRIDEVNTKLKGYTYDTSIYTLTVTVKDKDGILEASQVIVNGDKRQVSQITFVNRYGQNEKIKKETIKKETFIQKAISVAKTGDVTTLIPYLSALTGAILVILFIIIRKRREDQDDEDG